MAKVVVIILLTLMLPKLTHPYPAAGAHRFAELGFLDEQLQRDHDAQPNGDRQQHVQRSATLPTVMVGS